MARRNKYEEKRITFTKRWVSIILSSSILWISFSYILAFCGKEQIAESLSQTVATVVIATIIPYFCKSYFETYASEKNRLKEKQMDIDNPPIEDFNDYSNYK